jgi:hypothetical protein
MQQPREKRKRSEAAEVSESSGETHSKMVVPLRLALPSSPGVKDPFLMATVISS